MESVCYLRALAETNIDVSGARKNERDTKGNGDDEREERRETKCHRYTLIKITREERSTIESENAQRASSIQSESEEERERKRLSERKERETEDVTQRSLSHSEKKR